MADADTHGPRGLIGRIARSQGLLVPWVLALVLALAVAFVAPVGVRWSWYGAAAGVCLIVSFVVQIIIGRSDGFLLRTSTASLGSVLIVGLVSLVEALLTVVATGLQTFPAAGA
ncbi:hypothetical protein [Microbacterium sp. ZXX196]|uniref:hypothetical protein n=1 Tax=Microbacterium sp. ZXX196 TaxID=2609291 RepID=UPI0012B76860|nr:hypothetical protein [Microbacterium sp. ZXX196]MTE23443.1 hypothetical protein [Microbacterium sp. ZXX196]